MTVPPPPTEEGAMTAAATSTGVLGDSTTEEVGASMVS